MTYRETIRKHADAEAKWISNGQYAHVSVRTEPMPRGAGIRVELPDAERYFPRKFYPAIEEGVLRVIATGVLGCEMTDLTVKVTGGSYHETDSTAGTFEKAAEQAVREALRQAEPFLLESVVRVSVKAPEEFVAAVIGDLNARRGWIEGMNHSGTGIATITAGVPESEMRDYIDVLAEIAQGRGTVSSEPAGYQDLPPMIAREIRYCSRCQEPVIPMGRDLVCPNCGSRLDSDGDDSGLVPR